MKYKCSRCGYKSPYKRNVERHISKKTPCGKGKVNILSMEETLCCKQCNKIFKSSIYLEKHQKVCEDNIKDEKIAELEDKLAKAEAKSQTVNNYVTQNIIIVNGYRQTSFEHLTDGNYKRSVHRMVNMVPQMIQDVHFNKKAPENHNIYISNIKNKYAMVYDGEKWCSKPQDQVITDLINDQEYAIEEWLGEGDKFPKEMDKFNKYLDRKENGVNGFKAEEIKEQIKEEVKLLLYNNRGLVKNKS